jgi:hypothetical protein
MDEPFGGTSHFFDIAPSNRCLIHFAHYDLVQDMFMPNYIEFYALKSAYEYLHSFTRVLAFLIAD